MTPEEEQDVVERTTAMIWPWLYGRENETIAHEMTRKSREDTVRDGLKASGYFELVEALEKIAAMIDGNRGTNPEAWTSAPAQLPADWEAACDILRDAAEIARSALSKVAP